MNSDLDRETLEERIRRELADGIDEELELELGDEMLARMSEPGRKPSLQDGIDRKLYFTELLRLQRERI